MQVLHHVLLGVCQGRDLRVVAWRRGGAMWCGRLAALPGILLQGPHPPQLLTGPSLGAALGHRELLSPRLYLFQGVVGPVLMMELLGPALSPLGELEAPCPPAPELPQKQQGLSRVCFSGLQGCPPHFLQPSLSSPHPACSSVPGPAFRDPRL